MWKTPTKPKTLRVVCLKDTKLSNLHVANIDTYCFRLTDKSAVAKSINVNSDSSPASRTDTDFSPLSSSETKTKILHYKKVIQSSNNKINMLCHF